MNFELSSNNTHLPLENQNIEIKPDDIGFVNEKGEFVRGKDIKKESGNINEKGEFVREKDLKKEIPKKKDLPDHLL